jgi:hypothetical protein
MLTGGGRWLTRSLLAPLSHGLAWSMAIHSRPDSTRQTPHLLAFENAPTRDVATEIARSRGALWSR